MFFLKGSTISCFGPEGVPGGLLNTYCWIMSTFRLGFLMFSGSCYNCSPSGWSFTFFHLAFVIVFFLQNDQESTKYRKIMCGRLRHSSLNEHFFQRSGIRRCSPWTWTGDWRGDCARLLSVGALRPLPPGDASLNYQFVELLQTFFSSRASCSIFPTTCGRRSSTRRSTRSPPG